MAIQPRIRWMIRRDFPPILDIEKQCFEHPWTQDDFTRVLRERNVIGLVIESAPGDVVGHMVYALHKNALEILNLGIHPSHQRQGHGVAIITKLTGKLSFGRRDQIRCMVRESNLDALVFLHRCGFRAGRIVRGFWDGSTDDAYEMVYRYVPDEDEVDWVTERLFHATCGVQP